MTRAKAVAASQQTLTCMRVLSRAPFGSLYGLVTSTVTPLDVYRQQVWPETEHRLVRAVMTPASGCTLELMNVWNAARQFKSFGAPGAAQTPGIT